MSSLVAVPSFNDRLAMVFGKTKAIDKSLKFASNISSFSSDIFREIGYGHAASKGLDALAHSFYTMRNGVKIFDTFQDLSQPSGDIHEVRMKWVQLICFTVADVVNPILYFESEGFYTLGKEMKNSMVTYAAKIGLCGLATNLLNSIYQFYNMLQRKKSVDSFFQEEALEQHVNELNQEKTNSLMQIERLKKCCKDLNESIVQLKVAVVAAEKVDDLICENSPLSGSESRSFFSHRPLKDTPSHGSESEVDDVVLTQKKLSLSRDKALLRIKELEHKIEACEAKLSVLDDYASGRKYLNEQFYQNILSLIEDILEISGAIISLTGVATIALPATTIIALIGVLSSAIALTKIWRQSALTEKQNEQYQGLIAHIEQVHQRLQ